MLCPVSDTGESEDVGVWVQAQKVGNQKKSVSPPLDQRPLVPLASPKRLYGTKAVLV